MGIGNLLQQSSSQNKSLILSGCFTDVLEQSAKHIAKHAQVAFGVLQPELMYMI